MTDTARRWVDHLPLSDIREAPRNPKRHQAEVIGASISHHGLVEVPTLDERTGRLVAGHGRLHDLQRRKDAGEQPPAGVEVDENSGEWLMPVLRGWSSRSDADAEGYLIVSNRSTELGGWDDPELARLLTDIRDDSPDLLAVTGFTDADLDRLLRTTDGIGGPATAFLTDLRKPVDDEDGGAGGGSYDPEGRPMSTGPYGPQGSAAEYAPMSWVLHLTQREKVRAALRYAQKTGDLGTSADALTAVAEAYLDLHGVTAEDVTEE